MADNIPVRSIAPGAWQRIKTTVYTVERQNNSKPNKIIKGRPTALGQWAKIQDGEDGKYSWVGLKFNEDGELEEDQECGKGDHTEEKGYAREARYRSEYVLEGSTVWLMPAIGQDFYVFDYNPGAQWVTSATPINFPRRNTSQLPGEGLLYFLEMNEDGELEAGQQKKVFNGYKSTIQMNDTKVAQVHFGLEGKWWISGVDC